MLFFKTDKELVSEIRRLLEQESITTSEVRGFLDSNKLSLREYLSIMYDSEFPDENKEEKEDGK